MRRRLGILASTAALVALSACGGGEASDGESAAPPDGDSYVGSDDPAQFECENATGDEDWFAEF